MAILKAEKDLYAAEVEGAVLVRIGAGGFSADEARWRLAESGHCWSVWLRK